ncbi:hypothetical protein N0V93_002530 [Gnomoniopsis smithogilvyi]|uniref:Uncharacterized protein n=1 Tax=Gnomoniopsis smithogilvyi TaxID=1191159 RepID=A0A9W8YYT2_9PEZI|nr:hypothetical protein N0V93_002530 [Gnomoniopsis smithogilvyi]
MPAATQVASWTLSNIGPVTTTFTPAPSCSGPYNVEIGMYREAFAGENITSLVSSFELYGPPCTDAVAPLANCIPSGSLVDSQRNAFTSTHSGAPNTHYRIDYYSPGLICPSGYSTVGHATKSTSGAVSSSGPAFVPENEDFWLANNPLEDLAPNILLQNLFEGESAVLCCPSNYTADVDGTCSSFLPDYPAPSALCLELIPGQDFDFSASTTETLFGSVFTAAGGAFITGTVPDVSTTIKLTTETGSVEPGLAYAPTWVAADVVDVLYLVYAPSDTAAASNAATTSSDTTGQTSMAATAKTNPSIVVMLLTVGMAFILGFIMLVPV